MPISVPHNIFPVFNLSWVFRILGFLRFDARNWHHSTIKYKHSSCILLISATAARYCRKIKMIEYIYFSSCFFFILFNDYRGGGLIIEISDSFSNNCWFMFSDIFFFFSLNIRSVPYGGGEWRRFYKIKKKHTTAVNTYLLQMKINPFFFVLQPTPTV